MCIMIIITNVIMAWFYNKIIEMLHTDMLHLVEIQDRFPFR